MARMIVTLNEEHVSSGAVCSAVCDDLSGATPPLKQAIRAASRAVEREVIEDVMSRNRRNRKLAARHLEFSYKALIYKLKLIGLTLTASALREGV